MNTGSDYLGGMPLDSNTQSKCNERVRESGEGVWISDTTCELHTPDLGVVTGTVQSDGEMNWSY